MLKEGDKAPLFNLVSDEGKKVALKDLKGKTVVLYFYPKDMTSGCTQEACDFRDLHPKFKKGDTVILGVSKDSVESHQKFKEKYALPFALLSDDSGEVCEKYGVWKQKSMYGRKYMGIERTTVVISPDGKIAKIYSKVKVKDHAQNVLNEL
ncbi:MAG: thioredoxin-dependent thiol peroxidase [Bdellovibrio sp.]|nr:thioredoxin-dependent thiol peroxidase [Bdellovibrio sp.]